MPLLSGGVNDSAKC